MNLLRKRASQTSESVWLAMVLACSGGLMDAYSFLGRDKVFANAQTGNLLLLDGIPIYNAEHMLGLFSIFQTEAIRNVTTGGLIGKAAQEAEDGEESVLRGRITVQDPTEKCLGKRRAEHENLYLR